MLRWIFWYFAYTLACDEKINILGNIVLHLFLHKYLDLGERIEHCEGDGGSEQEIRQGKGEYEDVSDDHYYQSRYLQEDTSYFGH